jgi:hypothetical protein
MMSTHQPSIATKQNSHIPVLLVDNLIETRSFMPSPPRATNRQVALAESCCPSAMQR